MFANEVLLGKNNARLPITDYRIAWNSSKKFVFPMRPESKDLNEDECNCGTNK